LFQFYCAESKIKYFGKFDQVNVGSTIKVKNFSNNGNENIPNLYVKGSVVERVYIVERFFTYKMYEVYKVRIIERWFFEWKNRTIISVQE